MIITRMGGLQPHASANARREQSTASNAEHAAISVQLQSRGVVRVHTQAGRIATTVRLVARNLASRAAAGRLAATADTRAHTSTVTQTHTRIERRRREALQQRST
jgi:hypothetical protein